MTPGEYRTAQNRINRRTAVQALALLRVANPASDRQWAALSTLLYRVVVPQRSVSRTLAVTYYASQAPRGRVPQVPPVEYEPAMTLAALARVRPQWEEGTSQRQAQAVKATAMMVRHGEQGGRDTVVQATAKDGVRFARTDPMPPCCAWCTTFISRGPVYLAEAAGSAGFMAHDHDTCVPVPVFPGRDWPGREQYEAAEAFYVEHASDAAPGRQLAAMRSAVAELGSPI